MTTSEAASQTGVMEANGLTAGYRVEPIIHSVDTVFRPGVITCLIGSNGAGKSTYLKTLFGLTRIISGTIRLDGRPIHPAARELALRGVAYVPQLDNVFPTLTVRENLDIGTYVGRRGQMARVLDLFPALGGALKRPAGKLSGGQRNMLAVGRALMGDPQVLLLDEATGGLAPAVAEEFWGYLERLARDGLTIAVVEQNVDRALQWSGYAYLFARGRVVASGTPSELSGLSDFETLFMGAAVPGR